MRVGIAKRALDDAPHCGDQCGYWRRGGKTTLCVVDGLGHGKQAEKAAKAAMHYVAFLLSGSLPDIFAGCDSAVRRTRGVAMGIAVIDERRQTLSYAGVGNTRALVARQPSDESPAGQTIRLSSSYGIVGGGYKTLSPETVQLMPGDLVIMFTDGLVESIGLAGYDDSLRADVQRLAEKMLQDWQRATDDAAVLVASSKVSSR